MRDPISMHSACTRFSWPCALMRGALGRTLRHSAALCGTLRHSAAISGHQVAISGHQWSSVAISGHQWPSVAISGHQWPSVAISGHQWPSVAISGHQRTSPSQVRQRRGGHRTRRATRSSAHGRACWRRGGRCRPRAQFGSHPPRPHLMKESISGHQCSSVAISAHLVHIHLRLHQWPAAVISAHQSSSVLIRLTQCQQARMMAVTRSMHARRLAGGVSRVRVGVPLEERVHAARVPLRDARDQRGATGARTQVRGHSAFQQQPHASLVTALGGEREGVVTCPKSSSALISAHHRSSVLIRARGRGHLPGPPCASGRSAPRRGAGWLRACAPRRTLASAE